MRTDLMAANLDPLASNRTVAAAAVAAAVAVTLLAVVGIAVQLGWIRPRVAAVPSGAATTSVPASGALAPGEVLVVPAEAPAARPEPLMPKYSAPTPPAPAPRVADEPQPPPAAPVVRAQRREESPPPPAPPRYAGRAAPVTPSFARGGSHPTSPFDPWPNPAACETCGRVTGITAYPDAWEVRVRLEDGSTRLVRYRSVPPFHPGDPVRIQNGRLAAD